MTWADKIPMPTAPVWHYHVPRVCSCTDGLTPDENWSVMEDGPRADPPFPGEGWLVCGFCDGDGWYWRREVPDDGPVASLVRKMAGLIANENTEHEASVIDAVWDACGTHGFDLTDDEVAALRSFVPKETTDGND